MKSLHRVFENEKFRVEVLKEEYKGYIEWATNKETGKCEYINVLGSRKKAEVCCNDLMNIHGLKEITKVNA